MRRINEYKYEIETAGTGEEKVFLTPGTFCGKTKCGIGLSSTIFDGSFAISLAELWRIVLVSTVIGAQCFVYALRKGRL